ncbi:MAG: hypothetical protein R3A48_06675 [Polyangiales bacterium]
MRRTTRVGAALCLTLVGGLLSPRECAAQDRFNTRQGRVTNGWFYRATTAIRLNPIGVFAEVRGGYRQRLFDPGRGPLILRNTYFAVAPSVVVSPAFVRPGLAVEFSPLAILNLSALVEYVQFFGSFNLAQTWQNSTGDYSNASVFGTAAGRSGDGEERARPAGEPVRAAPGPPRRAGRALELSRRVFQPHVHQGRQRHHRPRSPWAGVL